MIAKRTGRYRSMFEAAVAKALRALKVPVHYETLKLVYTVPERTATYTPDFVLPNGVIIECKGRFTAADRKKMLLVIRSNPDKDIRMLFQNARTKINKGSKTTYAMWCDKNKIKWTEGSVPPQWVNENQRAKSTSKVRAS